MWFTENLLSKAKEFNFALRTQSNTEDWRQKAERSDLGQPDLQVQYIPTGHKQIGNKESESRGNQVGDNVTT